MKFNFNRSVVLGSIGFDRIMSLPGLITDYILKDQINHLNVSFTVDSLKQEYGGTGANCAYGQGLLGLKPLLVSRLGSDGHTYLKHLKSVGVNTKHLSIDPKLLSAVGHVMTDKTNNQIWMYYPGSMDNPSEPYNLSSILKPKDLVILMPNTPTLFRSDLETLISSQTNYIFDPAFFIPNLSAREIARGIKHSLITIGNQYEIKLIEEKTQTSKHNLTDKTETIVIETLGGEGVNYYQNHKMSHLSACKLTKLIDPTGAGDAFRAGLISGLTLHHDLSLAVKMALVTSAYCVETFGTQNYQFTQEEFDSRLNANFKS